MKKPFVHTKCTVKLRKSDYREEWYLIIESYPVFKNGNNKPSRIIESLNRIITTPIWDKNRIAKTTSIKITYKPKRDNNGIIQCKSETDQDSCIYADNIRKIRQHEYDNASLYSNSEAELADLNHKSQCDFLEYFKNAIINKHSNGSKSIIVNWQRTYEHLKEYSGNSPILFADISIGLAEKFKNYLLRAKCGGNKNGIISQNTAATYFSIFKACLKLAFIDGYINTDISAKIKGIQERESRREHLTMEELNILSNTNCDKPTLKKAALFSALTGLRHCDIQKLKWKEIQRNGNNIQLNFTQQKTKGVEYMPISEQAYNLCGPPKNPEQLVFEDLPDAAWISNPLARWIKAAGINRKITFHCFRHTYATLQIAGGTDIYTVSKMLGHTNVKTTQVYAKVIDEKKQKAANVITLNNKD